jgi:hypothetical protein
VTRRGPNPRSDLGDCDIGSDVTVSKIAAGPGGQPSVAFAFTVQPGKIAAIDMAADWERLGELDLAIFGD